VVITAVEKFLDETVRTYAGGTGPAGGAFVEFLAKADQVDRGVLPVVADGVGLTLDLVGTAGGEAAVTEFLEEDEQPTFASQAGAGIRIGELVHRGLETLPCALETVPGTGGGLVETLRSGKMIILGAQAGNIAVAIDNAPQQINREDGPLGLDGLKDVLCASHWAPR